MTWWWFLVPLLTLGFGTSIMVLVGGLRLRSKIHISASVVYLASTVLFVAAAQLAGEDSASAWNTAAMPPFLLAWLGGTAHVLALQTQIRGRDPAREALLAAARRRVRRRREARQILAADPDVATELHIGRPDLPQPYDDGGLVDVNHVPASVLIAALDLRPAEADAIVSERDRIGGFRGADELMVYCEGLTPDRLAVIRERLVFVPR